MWREWHAGENAIAFFESRSEWQRELARRFPTAQITREAVGNRRFIYRAFVRRSKVGVFGRLRGFGYIVGASLAERIHGRQQVKKE